MQPIIQVKNLDFIYNKGKDNEYHALINVSLDIYPEEYIIIFGPSGCGKSTLLNVIAGLETPNSGNVYAFGKDLTKLNEREYAEYHRRETGFVFQAYNLITSLTVLDNVALPQIFVNVRKGKRDAWAKQLLERFGILKQANKIPTELSGGQQQRIGIARAIVNNPKIVLADEPVGNLDSNSAKNVLEIITELNEKEKKTIIMVTHNPENLVCADRIIYMKDGVITHEVVNHDKKKKSPVKEGEKIDENIIKFKPPSLELRDLMRAYQGLSPEQINILIMPYKAKIFSHHFITTRNMDETSVFEEVMQRRLLGAISQDEFFEVLHRNSMEGGVGFDKRTAEKIVRRVSRVVGIAYYIYRQFHQAKNAEGEHMKISAEEKAEKTTNYLLDTCYKEHRAHLSVDQIKLITEMVRQRLSGSIQKDEFFKKLDLPEREGGVGLNSKTVKAITDELELILILGFGIVQTNEIDTEERKNVGTQTKEVKLDTGVSLQDAINMEQEREEELKRK
ncbi:MAG: ABC transporter, ATP-binding protein [Candidatus Falkowbacteria bacterium GW2011_GWC2_38_22]|uniref:ABC transporter, ATP-binding protein n=1 Tax=Candidatus Falkowbacteria bacterium GW2011_GWE1_38_31 TaxID=1618638 RepID=A0A0G0M8Q8_9BACT|nr:MAG: ABC transporter, ATP-binding protein [Candidatus Falkowbacteria bacterium GW2011_GWF2_38_1205]KKQ61165.1 MAG: ABC transporter, ATP-binding protein [Candidatus Falkowbacteria bacterium GW2011_GWC2_38_22]KKQ63327.1 MAG: ABC transporter, ATP-binding protein [Candidatus Falkowbacteria bacterium GW2011_GWF1_38_22]KKQ65555.1 MAG: ABC transporter, ATP-binding protein [Candidatus Falkowbacteria bacterium GW2011_GWE2_38_254]KKQ70059.1 MAG: ABC transporter, ATP-binding protein [Candidatus Falkowb